MRLNLALAGKVIASIPLDKERWNSHDYLQAKRRLLTAVHAPVILEQAAEPVFYIQVGSKMNQQSKRKAPQQSRNTLQASR